MNPLLSRLLTGAGLLTALLTVGVTTAARAQGSASLEVAPSGAAPAGSTVTVKWSGPNAPGDYITVVRKGAQVSEYLNYQATSDGRAPVNPVSLVLPAEPGAYEIRYVFSTPRRVLAAVPYEVTAVAAAIDGPASVTPGARFEVSWTGPNNGGDWVTIVAPGTAPRSGASYVDARIGRLDSKTGSRTAELRAPADPGRYELRYVQQGRVVIGTRAIQVVAAQAGGAAAASGAAGIGGDNRIAGGGAAAGAPAAGGAAAANGAAGIGGDNRIAAGGAAAGAPAAGAPAAGGAAAGGAGARGAGAGGAAAGGAAAGAPAAGGNAAAPQFTATPFILPAQGLPTVQTPPPASQPLTKTPAAAANSPTSGRGLTALPPTNTATGGTAGTGVNPTLASTWSGRAACRLDANGGDAYSEQIIHVWTIAGGPQKTRDGTAVYDATWSATGEGKNKGELLPGPAQPTQPPQNYQSTWNITVPATSAPLTIEAAKGGVAITASRQQLISGGNAATGSKQYSLKSPPASCSDFFKAIGNPFCFARSAEAIGFAIEEWAFPKIEATPAGTRVSGSLSSTPSRAISPMQPNSVAASASCSWDFVLVGGQ